ncbi:MAG TPA: bifunctional tetrahydrofolate synthase/dihydrofolate synthase [Methylophilaceae bacterium]|nr:bifunctional tetrahydrofolate synthase/dihydrofolate synthase [Methylophilaceae bacterium]
MHIAKPNTVEGWLAYIEALHPKSIAMGLERVATVAKRLKLKVDCPIVTIAGTNGKGSSCAMLSQVYIDAGYRVGCYTSPHLLRYHERVRINNQQISDQALCAAFLAVETARQEVELTYFEMGTLAAMWYFIESELDVVILEVGLGGRLDAVNIFDADCAIVTNVDLDHTDYLGDTREKIGFEKAGVYRSNQIAICGDPSPPQSLLDYAQTIGAEVKIAQRDYVVKQAANGWCYQDQFGTLLLPALALVGDFQINNAASVVYAARSLRTRLPVADEVIVDALPKVELLGRFQYLHHHPDVIVDVAHNAHAVQSLVENLAKLNIKGRLITVFSMLADKDIASVVSLLSPQIDEWHIAEIEHPRAATLHELKNTLITHGVSVPIHAALKVEDAFVAACNNMTKNDKIVIFGSFFTVAAILSNWQQLEVMLNGTQDKA